MARLPVSAVAPATGGWGALGALVGLGLGWFFQLDAWISWILLMVFAAVPMWICDWSARAVRPSGLVASPRQSLMGVAVITLLLLGSMQLQLAWGGEKGAGVSSLVLPALLACVALALTALASPRFLSSTIPACGRFVLALLRGNRPGNEEVVAFMGWIVKAVFLPLMIAWSFSWVAGASEVWHGRNWFAIFATALGLLYAIDTAFATVGYMSTSERIDGQIRSVDRTWLGWLSALACYPPLSVLVLDTWLVYKTGSDWQAWFSEGSMAAWGWGGSILLLTAIYTWATVVFGPRFSNLTNRGIITSGPYRWGKHPAYLCKNLSWWLIFVPFLGNETTLDAVLHCLALLGVNAIYAIRAWTEERHLRSDPEYRAYAEWIAQNGWMAKARQLLLGRAIAGRGHDGA